MYTNLSSIVFPHLWTEILVLHLVSGDLGPWYPLALWQGTTCARTNWFRFFQFFSEIISFWWNYVNFSMYFVFVVRLESIFVNLYFDRFGICFQWSAPIQSLNFKPIQTAECVGFHSCLTPYPVSAEYNILYVQKMVNFQASKQENHRCQFCWDRTFILC